MVPILEEGNRNWTDCSRAEYSTWRVWFLDAPLASVIRLKNQTPSRIVLSLLTFCAKVVILWSGTLDNVYIKQTLTTIGALLAMAPPCRGPTFRGVRLF